MIQLIFKTLKNIAVQTKNKDLLSMLNFRKNLNFSRYLLKFTSHCF